MIISEIKQQMCDNYCRMPHEACDQDELDELCKYCPLDKMPESEERFKYYDEIS